MRTGAARLCPSLASDALALAHARTRASTRAPHYSSYVRGRYLGGAVSNSDAEHDDISMSEMYARYGAWVAELSDDERHELFVGTAKRFYRI